MSPAGLQSNIQRPENVMLKTQKVELLKVSYLSYVSLNEKSLFLVAIILARKPTWWLLQAYLQLNVTTVFRMQYDEHCKIVWFAFASPIFSNINENTCFTNVIHIGYVKYAYAICMENCGPYFY